VAARLPLEPQQVDLSDGVRHICDWDAPTARTERVVSQAFATVPVKAERRALSL